METRIKELREMYGIGQEALAHFVNSTQQTISRIENGWSVPSSDLIINIAKHFHVSTDYVLCLSDEMRTYESQYIADRESKEFSDVVSIYSSLNNTNRKTAQIMLKRLGEAQVENNGQ